MVFTSHNISLVETKSGKPSLKVKGEDGSEKALHSLYDPEAEAKSIVDAFQFDGNGILVVLGLGFGYHIKELLRRFPRAELVVVEAVPEIYEIAKEREEISDKVRYVVGLSPEEALREITRHQMKNGIAPVAVFTLSSAVSAFSDYYRPIVSALKKTVSIRLWERLKYPKFKNDSLVVAVLDSGYFLNVEVEKALKRLGHRPVKIHVRREQGSEAFVHGLIEKIIEFKPDFFLALNHLGFDEEGALTSFFNSIEMPVASWYVDSPNIIVREFKENVSPYVSLFLWDKGYMDDMRSVGFESVSYLPLATDETVFKPIKLSKKHLKAYRCDVGFVGNSMAEPTEERLRKLRKELHPLVEKVARLLSTSRMSFEEAVKSLDIDISHLPVQERIDFEAAAIWRATLLYRLSCVEMLKGFGHHIHGDRGWSKLLSKDYKLYPPLNYYRELPLFYNACRVNLNATSLQMGGAVNQRVFDVPACGGFLLTDQQEELSELFEEGKEVITYKEKGEIPELVRFYLDNSDKRKTVAQRARDRVLSQHTYRHRLNSMIESMRKRYAV